MPDPTMHRLQQRIAERAALRDESDGAGALGDHVCRNRP